MGRSRAVPPSADDDPSQRSKRKRATSSIDNFETATTGRGTNEGKVVALYHCNYCNKDLSGKIRIKCAMCPDFDLCVECFSVGVEVTPHKSSHAYRVMDNLSFPLICPDWNADEEILLLEGIEMYGLGNWTEVAEHVGTKGKSQCVDHYNTIYMNSSCFPLPDMSHVMGKNREELLAMAKKHSEVKKGFSMLGEVNVKEESSLSKRVKIEEGTAGRSSSSLAVEVGSGLVSSSSNTPSGVVKASDAVHVKDNSKMEGDRSVGEKKPRTSGDEEPSITEHSGYNPKRQEFEVEYDNEAEQLLADMEFRDTDSNAEHELKLRILRIYSKRLDERKRRKDFILERKLLYPDPLEKNLSVEEREIYQKYKVFMRFHSKEDHEELLNSIIEEHRIRKRIQDLQEARAAGCRTSAEADRFLEQKRKKEAQENAHKAKESTHAGLGGKVLQKANLPESEFNSSPRGAVRGCMGREIGDLSTTAGATTISASRDDWDVTGFVGADLLSENEKWLCGEIRILPSHYLNMLETMSVEILNGNLTNKVDAHSLFKVEPGKVDRVYDMLMQKGVVQP